MFHQLKIQRKYYNRIMSGQKMFEVRDNDRDYQVGDEINFTINTDREARHPELTSEVFLITYVHMGLGMMAGYAVLGLMVKKVKEPHVTN